MYSPYERCTEFPAYARSFSEDMIDLLGKRPFANRADDMDKWLDENRPELVAPPPFEPAPEAPAAAATKHDLDL